MMPSASLPASVPNEVAQLGGDMHALLRQMDPARWHEAHVTDVHERLQRIKRSCDELSTRVVGNPEGAVVAERLRELSHAIDDRLPPSNAAAARWQELRLALLPAYERLAHAARALTLQLPSVRPTNYARNAYHLANGVVVIAIVHELLSPAMRVGVAFAVAALAWGLEGSRRVWPKVNQVCMAAFRPFAHPHEAWRINSATWYATALAGLAVLPDLRVITVALASLAAGDPLAALVGRRFGRHRFANGRSVEGAVAFVLGALVLSTGCLALWHPELGGRDALGLSLAGAVAAALAELWVTRVDDNLAIPWAAAAGAGLFAVAAW